MEAKQAKLEDSNIALLGSDIERQVKLASAQSEKEWIGCGQAPGLEIWRIEKFAIKKWPKDQYGKFYEGDSYIVLKTYKKPDADKLLYNAHFWLGTYTTQDEAGTAAYKTVELDTLLKDVPVQYREVQGYESALFLGYFPHFQLLKGGIDSGFNHVEPQKYTARLLHVKGKKNVRVWQVPLSSSSLNEGDVFVLDSGLKLWVWIGSGSGPFERRRGEELAGALKAERGGKPTSTVLVSSDNDPEFWKLLGGKGAISPASAGGDDLEAEQKHAGDVKLFNITPNDFKQVGAGELSWDLMVENQIYMLDNGVSLYIWLGKNSSRELRGKVMARAMQFLSANKRPFYTAITRLIQGGETDEFKRSFKGGAVQAGAPLPSAPADRPVGDSGACCVVM